MPLPRGAVRKQILLTAVSSVMAARALAQVDASWIGPAAFEHEAVYGSARGPVNVLNQGHSWTDSPNWTSQPFPDQDGAATIALAGNGTAADRQARIIITLDQTVALREISFANSAGVDITDTQPAINASLIASETGLTIRSSRYHPETPSRANYFHGGNYIAVPIGGDGEVTVSGGAVVTFSKTNTFTGALNLNGGVLAISGTSLDAKLGAGNLLRLSNGTLRAAPNSGAAISRNITLSGGGGTIANSSSSALHLNGIIDGAGALRTENRWLRLNGQNIYNGPTTVAGDGLIIAGSIRNSSAIDSLGVLQLNRPAGSLEFDRIGDNTPVILRGGVLAMSAADAAPMSETIGTLTAAGGLNTIRFAGAAMSLQSSSIVRNHRAGVFIDGPAVGVSSTLQIANLAAYATGGDGGALTSTQKIVPWMYAYAGPDAGTHNGSGRGSFVTVGATGARPLDLITEYAALSMAAAEDNVRVTSNQSVGMTGKTINALLLGSSSNLDTGASSTVLGGTLTISSGAILNTTRGNVIQNAINFGSAEGVIISASTAGANGDLGLSMWGPLSGSNGVTKFGPGDLFLGGASTFSGPVTIGSGRVTIIDDVLPNGASPLGQSADPIILVAGGTQPGATETGGGTRLTNGRSGGSLTIARPIIVRGATHQAALGAALDNAADTGVLNILGGVQLESVDASLGLTRGRVVFASPISGPGRMRDAGAITIAFAAPSPGWTGGIEMSLNGGTTHYEIASSQALGVGTVFVGATSRNTIRAVGRREIANPVLFALAATNSAVTFDGDLTFTGSLDFGGNVGRPIVVPAGANVTINGAANNGSFRLLGGAFGAAQSGGTLTLASATDIDGRILIGDPGYAASSQAPTAGATLRITHNAALGRAGVQIDASGSMIQLDGSAGNLDIAGGDLFLRNTGVNGQGALYNSAGANHANVNIAITADASIGVATGTSLQINGALADLSAATAGFGTATLTKTGGGRLLAWRIANSSLQTGEYAGTSLQQNAIVKLNLDAGEVVVADLPGARRPDQVSVVRDLQVNPSARLDLGDSAMIVDYATISPRAAIEQLIESAYNNGAWNGSGIATSANGAIAVVEANEVTSSFPFSYLGQRLDATSLIVTFTLPGDADLNGTVDINDFALLAANFNRPSRWFGGDFNYDSQTTLGDFALLAQRFNQSLDAAPSPRVPEPSITIFLSLSLFANRQNREQARG